MIAYDMRVCHDFDPKSFEQVQEKRWMFLHHINIAFDLRVRHEFDPGLVVQSHYLKMQNSCLGHIL